MKNVSEVIEYLKSEEGANKTAAEIVEILEGLPQRGARAASGERRGQLAGLKLEEMTLDQLKREKINASSVLYKAQQRGASESTISANQARVDAVVARLAELQPQTPAPETEATAETTARAEANQEDVNPDVAAEV